MQLQSRPSVRHEALLGLHHPDFKPSDTLDAPAVALPENTAAWRLPPSRQATPYELKTDYVQL